MFLGTDLIYVPRIERMIARFGESFLNKVLTADELCYCQAQSASHRRRPLANMVAARLAVKESVAKALGVGLNGLGFGEGVSWKEIEVDSQYQKSPQLRLHNTAKRYADNHDITFWCISWSHDGDYAMATVWGSGSFGG